jgi:hypothetical protein
MMTFDKLTHGTWVYWLSAVVVKVGKVVLRSEKPRPTVVVQCGDGSLSSFTDFRELHDGERDAWLTKAIDCQRRAAELLAEATTAFARAGLPIPTVTPEPEPETTHASDP